MAIAHPTRRAILALLALQPMTPNALAAKFDDSRQAVSKHIRVLEECQVLGKQKQGREIFYHFEPAQFREISDWMQTFMQTWEQRLNQLDALLNDTK